MDFKEWFQKSGHTYSSFERAAGVVYVTIKHLMEGGTAQKRTIDKLVHATACWSMPIKPEMFKTFKEFKKNQFKEKMKESG